MKLRSLLTLALATICVAGQAAPAAEIEGVRFAEQLRVGADDLRLHGTGVLRYRVVIKGYVAALYLPESFAGDPARAALGDRARRLEIEYFWPIPAEKFGEATVVGISRNVDAATFEALRGRIDRINALYRDVEPGDRYALTYAPGVGTELSHNGERLGVVEGEDFAAALFAIWLGDEPLDASLREQLLARR